MEKLMLLSFLFVFFYSNVFAQVDAKLLERGSDYLSLTFTNRSKATYEVFVSESGVSTKSYYIKSIGKANQDSVIDYNTLQIQKNLGRYLLALPPNTSKKFTLTKLSPRTEYHMLFFRREGDSLTFSKEEVYNTLAEPPKRCAKSIAFDNVTDTSIVLSWLNGDGEGRVVLIAEGESVDQPENGKEYTASAQFGKSGTRIGKSFVVYDGKEPRPKIEVKSLKPATKYIVAIYEYNGSGKYRNYNIKSENNIRKFTTKLPTPKIQKVVKTESETYLIVWNRVLGASTYIIDISNDRNFQSLVEPYVNLDVGNLGEYEIDELEPNRTYFVRIKAKGSLGESLYSPPFEFKTK